jgi:YidC/Oxa1 family membrane protein insertase
VLDVIPGAIDLGAALSSLNPAAIPIWSQYVDLLEWGLDHLAEIFHSAGVAVIVFTILIKTLLLPLTIKSIKSAKAMQELQPKIKELQKKYGKDRQRLSQETMRLYGQYQVNPMAGCLPMIIQIPIFFGLYRSILNLSKENVAGASEYWTGSFLWLDNLKDHDPLYILPIAAGVFQFVQTRMMRPANQKITDPQQAMMNTMMNFMPLMVVIFGWQFAAGPVLYWVTQSIYSVVQQWLITGWGALAEWIPGLPELPEHRRLGYRPPRDLDDVVVLSGDGALPERKGAMGWLQRRMEEAQKQQQERMAARTGAATATSGASESGASTTKGPRPVKKGSPAARPKRATAYASDSRAEPETEEPEAEEQATTNGTRPRAVPRKSRASRQRDGS